MSPRDRYDTLVQYAKLKLEEKDWHGVSDAANDIRELVAVSPEVEAKIPLADYHFCPLNSRYMPFICVGCNCNYGEVHGTSKVEKGSRN